MSQTLAESLTLRCVRQEDSIVNVASVPQLSPFRYPGGKTWLVPEIRRWVEGLGRKPSLFVEPFAGGAIASLTVAAENRAEHVEFCEIDPSVASVWRAVLSDAEALCQRILEFDLTPESARSLLAARPTDDAEVAFQTIVRNRVQHGGIMAPGASLMKDGENGRGIRSRWYPKTLATRIRAIQHIRSRLAFVEGDGFDLIRLYAHRPDVCFFVDPPYTAGGSNAGRRLYSHNEVDHALLFGLLAQVQGSFLLTYDNAEEVLRAAERHSMKVKRIPMKNTHHELKVELLISNAFRH